MTSDYDDKRNHAAREYHASIEMPTPNASSDNLQQWLALGDLIQKKLTQQLRPWHITLGEYQVLQLFGSSERRQVDIANTLRRSRVTVSRQASRLIELDCLERTIDAGDRRVQWLKQTEEGARVHRETHRALTVTLQALTSPMDHHWQDTLAILLKNIDALAADQRYGLK